MINELLSILIHYSCIRDKFKVTLDLLNYTTKKN